MIHWKICLTVLLAAGFSLVSPEGRCCASENSLLALRRYAGGSVIIEAWFYDPGTGQYGRIWRSDPIPGEVGHWDVYDIDVADADNDGANEIVVATKQGFCVYKEGLFHGPYRNQFQHDYISLQIADVDHDDSNEVVVSEFDGRAVEIWKWNVSQQTFEQKWRQNVERWEYWIVGEVCVGDCDNDGQQEFLVGGYNRVAVCRFDVNTQSYLKWLEIPAEGSINVASIADVDGDGLNEVITGGSRSEIAIWVFAEGEGNFALLAKTGVGGWIQAISIADVDNDSVKEIVIGTIDDISQPVWPGHVGVWHFDSDDLSFRLKYRIDMNQVDDIEIGDLDNDGLNELYVYEYGWPCYGTIYNPVSQDSFTQVFRSSGLLSGAAGPAPLPSAVEERDGRTIPDGFELTGGFPNPFNSTVHFQLRVPKLTEVSLAIYDNLGRVVRSLRPGPMNAGAHIVSWDGSSQAGLPCPSGVYVLKARYGRNLVWRKVVLLR